MSPFYIVTCIVCYSYFISVSNASWWDERACIGRTANESLRLFPQEPDCGTSICPTVTGRMKGGEDAELGEFPWMATIVVHYSPTWLKYDWFTIKKQRCAGTIINDKHILSAGHCFLVEEETMTNFIPLDISGVKAYVGDWDLSTDPDTVGGKTAPSRLQVEVERIFFYPGYRIERNRLWWDVALIRLTHKLQFHEYVKPICLPFGCNQASISKFERNSVVLAGWGYYKDGDELPDRLQRIFSSISEQKQCREAWAEEAQEIEDFQVCVKANFRDSILRQIPLHQKR